MSAGEASYSPDNTLPRYSIPNPGKSLRVGWRRRASVVNTSVINRNIHSLYLNFCKDVNWCFCYYVIHVEGNGLKQQQQSRGKYK